MRRQNLEMEVYRKQPKTSRSSAEAEEEESDTKQEGDEEVEKVVEHVRHPDGTCDYKLKCEGCDDPAEDTWHHEDGCKHCEKIVTKYW